MFSEMSSKGVYVPQAYGIPIMAKRTYAEVSLLTRKGNIMHKKKRIWQDHRAEPSDGKPR